MDTADIGECCYEQVGLACLRWKQRSHWLAGRTDAAAEEEGLELEGADEEEVVVVVDAEAGPSTTKPLNAAAIACYVSEEGCACASILVGCAAAVEREPLRSDKLVGTGSSTIAADGGAGSATRF